MERADRIASISQGMVHLRRSPDKKILPMMIAVIKPLPTLENELEPILDILAMDSIEPDGRGETSASRRKSLGCPKKFI